MAGKYKKCAVTAVVESLAPLQGMELLRFRVAANAQRDPEI